MAGSDPPTPGPPVLAGIDLACRPLVYLYVVAGCIQYVGATRHGLSRPLGRHHVLSTRPRSPQDVLIPISMDSWEAAEAFEQRLIAAIRPPWNATERRLAREVPESLNGH